MLKRSISQIVRNDLGGGGKNPATREQGDLSGDGTVAGADYTEVITYWGSGTPPPEPGSIPEPATIGLLALAGTVLLAGRRRQSS